MCTYCFIVVSFFVIFILKSLTSRQVFFLIFEDVSPFIQKSKLASGEFQVIHEWLWGLFVNRALITGSACGMFWSRGSRCEWLGSKLYYKCCTGESWGQLLCLIWLFTFDVDAFFHSLNGFLSPECWHYCPQESVLYPWGTGGQLSLHPRNWFSSVCGDYLFMFYLSPVCVLKKNNILAM